MSVKKHRWILPLIAALLALTAPAALSQGAYPNRPIKLIVPWTPAGTTDIAARYLAERLSARLGQPVIVENRAGATGQIGSQAVAQAPADGYTLLVMSATVHSVSPNLSKSFPFDPIDDFTPISQFVSFPYVMVVSANSPYRSVADLTSAAKKDPGKIAYASFGIGSAPFLITELLAMATGSQFLHVPYKGAAQALTDIAGGQITFFIDSLPSPLGQIRGGRMRALSVTTPQRSPTLPDVPTIAETVPGFEAIAWLGVAAPPRTPRDIANKLHEQLKLIAAEPEYGAKLRNIGLEPVASASPEQFRSWLVAQKEYWGKVVRDSKIPLTD
jgi:tripartite-type tricarboxylate transporter receptor subunit TctC